MRRLMLLAALFSLVDRLLLKPAPVELATPSVAVRPLSCNR